MEYEHIERLLGLHEELHIIYCVDRFEAQLYVNDGKNLYEDGQGITVKAALIDLNRKLEHTEVIPCL